MYHLIPSTPQNPSLTHRLMQWNSVATVVLLCHLRAATKAVGKEVGQFDSDTTLVCHPCRWTHINIWQYYSFSDESRDDTFSNSPCWHCMRSCNIFLLLILALFVLWEWKPYSSLRKRIPSTVCACLTAAWAYWLPRLLSVKLVFIKKLKIAVFMWRCICTAL